MRRLLSCGASSAPTRFARTIGARSTRRRTAAPAGPHRSCPELRRPAQPVISATSSASSSAIVSPSRPRIVSSTYQVSWPRHGAGARTAPGRARQHRLHARVRDDARRRGARAAPSSRDGPPGGRRGARGRRAPAALATCGWSAATISPAPRVEVQAASSASMWSSSGRRPAAVRQRGSSGRPAMDARARHCASSAQLMATHPSAPLPPSGYRAARSGATRHGNTPFGTRSRSRLPARVATRPSSS